VYLGGVAVWECVGQASIFEKVNCWKLQRDSLCYNFRTSWLSVACFKADVNIFSDIAKEDQVISLIIMCYRQYTSEITEIFNIKIQA
jgi:hypothetical protein